eukprot:6853104-Lingulodinium_polyedra.AAC.1
MWRACTAGPVREGQPLLAQAAESEPAMWPAEGPHWTPPPRQVDDGEATAGWQRTRCHHCREQRRVLVAR